MNSKKTTLLLIRVLERIISDKKTHALWLNTLSFLEYIGSRKMLKSLAAEHLDITLLSHINEETRHSLFFKRLSQKVLPKNMSFKKEEMICGDKAEAYFQKVDQLTKMIPNSNTILNYLYTSYLVETRAISVYKIYNKILERNNLFSIKAILQEEETHLQSVAESIRQIDPLSDYNMEKLKQKEYSFYFSLLHDLEEELNNSLPVSPQPFKENPSSVKQQI